MSLLGFYGTLIECSGWLLHGCKTDRQTGQTERTDRPIYFG